MRLPKVALLLAVVVLAAFASQPTLNVTQVNPSTGAVTQTTFDRSSSTAPRAPLAGKYWDGVASTNYYNTPTSVIPTGAVPNPQIGVGPDDVIVIANRSIARWPNPNAMLNSLVSSPYNNPPTSLAFLDNWLGIANLTLLCPTLPRSSSTCVIDNASIRYDQLQGRFVVLFTITDVPARVSNFALIVSKFGSFNNIPNVNTSALFVTPTIAGVVGGVPTGNLNTANWFLTTFSMNVTLAAPVTNSATQYRTALFCAVGAATAGPITTGCSNYFPTGARMGLDNDNLILTAPVLDESQSPTVAGPLAQPPGGPYAGTRVVTVPKLAVYNFVAPTSPASTTPTCSSTATTCGAFNLSDDTATGTLTGTAGNPVPTTGTNPILPIFWEPDNLRGRAMASFDAQVSPASSTATGGVISPIDYLVGTRITDSYNAPLSALGSGGNVYYVQPIVFTCPAQGIFSAPAGVTFCGILGGGQVPDAPVLGPLDSNAANIGLVGDANLVGQGAATTAPALVGPSKLFVGDSRPQQIIYREGLLYSARTLRAFDASSNPFGSSTVLYNILSKGSPASIGSYSVNGTNLPLALNILETKWLTGGTPDPNGYGFYAPMYDVPANVISGGPTSPINLFPWLEKLFVGMTTGDTANLANTFNGNHPSLWDFRPGDDAYDTTMAYLDPYTGALVTNLSATTGFPSATGTIPIIQLSTRGGATTDPNDGSLWLTGAFAKFRNSGIPGPGVWGTSMANYELDFPAVDPYGNDNAFFADVPSTHQFFTWIQIAKNLGLAAPFSTSTANCTAPPPGSNPPILPPPTGPDVLENGVITTGSTTVTNLSGAGASDSNLKVGMFVNATGIPAGTTITAISTSANTVTLSQAATSSGNVSLIFTTSGNAQVCNNFNPNDQITRAEMARWVVLGQMDPNQIHTYLCATGGDPTAACPLFSSGPTASSFADDLTGLPAVPGAATVNCTAALIANPSSPCFGQPTGSVSTPSLTQAIEVMYRRGYTKGCSFTSDGRRNYCPGDKLTRNQMAVFLIRAKMNNVFPTTLSGIPLSSPYGDNFGVLLSGTPYFTDVPTTDGSFIYIQKMRELRITNGLTTCGTPGIAPCGTYGNSATDFLTRAQIATFIVRAFFL